MAGKREETDGRFSLPEDIAVDILLRLPVKTLGRFRCVSKTWNHLISDPVFIKTHLNRHNTVFTLVIWSKSLYTLEPGKERARKLVFQGMKDSDYYSVLGSCNGLLLVGSVYGSKTFFLLNPATKESKKLPDSPFVVKNLPQASGVDELYGFGYDSSGDDYKVVKILSYGCYDDFHKNVVCVYSQRTNVWKRIQDAPFDFSRGRFFPGVFINGALHWLVMGSLGSDSDDEIDVDSLDGMIASLDLTNEKFRSMPIPGFVSVDEDEFRSSELGILSGCLSISVSQDDGAYLNVFVMQKYGVSETWSQYSIHIPHSDLKPLGFSDSDKILMELDGEKLVWYDIEEETLENMVIDGIPDKFEAGTYLESLVSPNWYYLRGNEMRLEETINNRKRGKKRKTKGC